MNNLPIILLCVLTCPVLFAHAGDVYVDTSNASELMISSTPMAGAQVIQVHDAALQSVAPAPLTKVQALPYHHEVVVAAKLTNLDPALIHAVIEVESGHQAHRVSKKGAYGLMQLMPATALRYKVGHRQNAQQNIIAGAQYLKELLALFNNDVSLALAAYNAGPNTVKRYQYQIPPYLETKRYVPKVLKYYRQYTM